MKSSSERFLLLQLLLITVTQLAQAALPTFITPKPDGSTSARTVTENSPSGGSILMVEGQDTDGDPLTFSIVTQVPISPPFELDTTSGEFRNPANLDYETTKQFNFTFGVSDGGVTQTSVVFTVNIEDVNDNTPTFASATYSETLEDSTGSGVTVLTVVATDADSPPFDNIAYSISAGDTNNVFTIDSSGNIITNKALAGEVGTFALTIQASDGTNVGSTAVTLTVRVDYCTPDPCVNGNCSNFDNGYNCTCDAGFRGQNCSEVDYCFSGPCVNGICSNTGNGYNCACDVGFLGQNCSEVDYCIPDPCSHGNCSNTGSGYLCSCEVGFLGRNCSEVDFCNPDDPCVNGTCVTIENGYQCNCTDGFIGQNCSQVDFCYLSPCSEGSTCSLNSFYNYTCNCVEGFVGRNCTEVDFCYTSPCLEGSTCSLNGSVNYTCNCAEGFMGRNCEKVDYCNSAPCQNGGVCTNGNSGYTCDCTGIGYTGTNCTETGSTSTTATTTLLTPSSTSGASGGAGTTDTTNNQNTAGQATTAGAGDKGSSLWIIGVVFGILIVIIIIICFLRYLRVIFFYKVPCCGEAIEAYLGKTRERTDSERDASRPINEPSSDPNVDRKPAIELETKPNTDGKTSFKSVNESSEKYTIKNDEKTSVDITSETNKTDNGNLKDTSNKAEEKSVYSNIDEKENITTSM